MITNHQMRLMGLGTAVKSFGNAQQHFNPAQCFANRLQQERNRIKRMLDAIRMDEVSFSAAGTKLASMCRKLVL